MSDDPKNDPEVGLTRVVLSAGDLDAAARLLSLLLRGQGDRGQDPTTDSHGAGWPTLTAGRAILVERARRTFVNRARRSGNFSKAMFGEPAWDMLLALYATEHSARHTVSELGNLAGVPPTTALRWLDFLENKEQLVVRRPSATDKRVCLIELSDKARDALDMYFSGTVGTEA